MFSDDEDKKEPPKTLTEAEARRKELIAEVQGIQAQLGDKQRTGKDHRRLSPKEYWTWRKKAQAALNHKLSLLRQTKAWIREHRQNNLPPIDPISAVGYLSNLYQIIMTLKDEEVDFDEDEEREIDAAGAFLGRVNGTTN